MYKPSTTRKNVEQVCVLRRQVDERGRIVDRLERLPVRRSHRSYRKILIRLDDCSRQSISDAFDNIVCLLSYFGEKPKFVCRIDGHLLFGVTEYCVSCLEDCYLIVATDEVRMSSKLRARKYPAYVLDADRALAVGAFMNDGGINYALRLRLH